MNCTVNAERHRAERHRADGHRADGHCRRLCAGRCAAAALTVPTLIVVVVLLREFAVSSEQVQAEEPKSATTFQTSRDRLLRDFASEFVPITPGKGEFPAAFDMGSSDGPPTEQPRHRVKLTRPFAMARFEVTQNLYAAVMGSNPSRWKGPRNSAEMLTWADAVEFCSRVTVLMREAGLIGADEVIRLPAEAEWEYCCRAGTSTRYSFGDEARREGDADTQATRLDAFAWHTGNAAGNDPPVGALKPNAWGLYDMHGYLWEFVQDEWAENYQGAPADGSARVSAASDSPRRVVRGGSWRERFDRLTSTARMPVTSDFRRDDVGFRCVRAKAD